MKPLSLGALRFALLAAVSFLKTPELFAAEFPTFTVHRIDNFGKSIGQTALVDVDRDGDLDWIAGNASYSGGEIFWWEFQAPDRWVRHALGKGNTDVGGAAFDVNGDGWVDFVAGSILLLNSGQPKTKSFVPFEIGTIHSHDTEFADVNSDGRIDLVANSDKSGLFWYEIPAIPTNKWIPHLIGSLEEHKVHGGVSPRAVADLDGDGDNDIVTAQGWYENLGGGLKWRFRKNIDLGEPHQFGISVRTWVCDMDGDRDIDIVQAENDNPDGRIAWFENDGNGNWTRHIIRDEGRGEDFHSLAVADFDGDGDLDVYSGAGPISASKKFACYIWENAGGKWIEHKIADQQCHEAEAADVDGDGDIDICSKPWSGTDEHFFLRNMQVESKRAGSGGFAYPISTAHRRFIDQTGKIYLLKTMSSWAMSQNCSDAEITQALEGLKALRFNAVTVSPFGVHMNDSFGDRYKNKAGQSFFTGRPHASSLGPAWSSMDWVMREATRLEMTVVFSFFLSWKDTGTVPDMIAGGTTNAYDFGKAVATRYASYSNIVWHVMGDFKWRYNEGPALALDAIFRGIRDAEGTNHRLIIAEPANGSTSFDQFISTEGAVGYRWFKQSAETIYHYGSNSAEQFDKVYRRPGAATYPVVDIEPPYVNAPHYKGQQNQELRERNYATFIRGGAGINFGHEKWWPHGVTGLFDGGAGWLNVLSEAPQLDAKHAWTILDVYVTDPTWMPDDGAFLKNGLGTGDDQAASGYSSTAALVYFPTNRPIVIDTTKIAKGANVRLRWYDPTRGNYTTIASSEAKSSNRSLPYPATPHADGFNDWVLVADGE